MEVSESIRSDAASTGRGRGSVAVAFVVGLVALAVFGWGLSDEPHFVDESAYFAQAGYADLLITNRDDPSWLDYAGFDLPPLPKYLVGLSLALHGYDRPHPRAAWEWYRDTSRRFEPPGALLAARRPVVVLGALGCVAIYALGTISSGRIAGVLAALLLMINPLYRLHARRAMSDVPAEAFLLIALALGAAAWVRFVGRRNMASALALSIAAGAAVGFSVLSKLNGVISGLTLMSWAALGVILLSRESRARGTAWATGTSFALLFSMLCAGLVSFGIFVALNPFLTAQPAKPYDPRLEEVAVKSFSERVAMVADHRVAAMRQGQKLFPDDALPTIESKITAVAVQGFGRFGPFGPAHADSRIRFDALQDAGAWIWGPITIVGFIWAVVAGKLRRRCGEIPGTWLAALQFLVAAAAVTASIPLAWDRYYLSLQPSTCLLAAILGVGLLELARRGATR
ncbi:MAG: phospholipid carrier-dependent glycosyltransferase [Isosphaeraceae bacterium]|nr:phospholipid carrier-dependent glycosyltransferase [Isosphaeraceae bacterium]